MAKDEKIVVGVVGDIRLCWDGKANWTVRKAKQDEETGEEVLGSPLGYFPKLEGAAERILRMRINAKAKGDLQDMIVIIEKAKREVVDMLQGIEGTPARGCVTLDDMPAPEEEESDWGDDVSGDDDGADW